MIRYILRRMIVWAMKEHCLDGKRKRSELFKLLEPFKWPCMDDCPLSILEFSQLPESVRQSAADTRDFDTANGIIAEWKRKKDAAERKADCEFGRRLERHRALHS